MMIDLSIHSVDMIRAEARHSPTGHWLKIFTRSEGEHNELTIFLTGEHSAARAEALAASINAIFSHPPLSMLWPIIPGERSGDTGGPNPSPRETFPLHPERDKDISADVGEVREGGDA